MASKAIQSSIRAAHQSSNWSTACIASSSKIYGRNSADPSRNIRFSTSSATSTKPDASPAPPLPSSSRPSTPAAGKGKRPASSSADTGSSIPPLSRPLGIPTKPSSREKTWDEKKGEILSEERHKAKRKELMREATKGYFHDYNKARSASGGKLWMAPPVLIKEDRALYFPDISGKSLLGETAHTTDLLKGKITLLSILTTRISEEHVDSFLKDLLPNISLLLPPSTTPASSPNPSTDPVLTESPSSSESSDIFQTVQINHQQNPLKSILLSFFVNSLKRSISKDNWGRYLVSSGEWSHFDVEGPLGIENKLVGYVFLIDQNMKVRWAGCGPATEKEAEDLRTATAVLLKRAKEGVN